MLSVARLSRSIAAFGLLLFVSSSCGIVEPCQTIIIDAADTMEGAWRLSTVLGGSLPATGLPIPQGSVLEGNFHVEYLKAGTLRFVATQQGGDCKSKKNGVERGRVIASYVMVNANGTTLPSLVYGGSYTYDRATSVLTLTAAGKQASGTRALATLSLVLKIKDFEGRIGFAQQSP